MTQRREFRLPDVGEGLTEADIVSWRVKPGDSVQINQIIVDIETAKAVVELPCPFEGVVASLLVAEGETVDVGTPIIAVDVAGAAGPDAPAVDPAAIAAEGPRPAADDLVPPLPPPSADQPAAAPAAEERQAVLVGYGVKTSATARRARKTPATSQRSVAEVSAGAQPAANGGGRPATVLAKPLVRKLARDLGVDLAGQEERIPVRGVRKHTAAAVTASAFTAPHVTEFLQVEVGATMDAVARLRDLPEFAGVRVSPLLMVARALLIAVKRHPVINSTWDEAAQEIVVKHSVNLGIAAATERGLIVPNV